MHNLQQRSAESCLISNLIYIGCDVTYIEDGQELYWDVNIFSLSLIACCYCYLQKNIPRKWVYICMRWKCHIAEDNGKRIFFIDSL